MADIQEPAITEDFLSAVLKTRLNATHVEVTDMSGMYIFYFRYITLFTQHTTPSRPYTRCTFPPSTYLPLSRRHVTAGSELSEQSDDLIKLSPFSRPRRNPLHLNHHIMSHPLFLFLQHLSVHTPSLTNTQINTKKAVAAPPSPPSSSPPTSSARTVSSGTGWSTPRSRRRLRGSTRGAPSARRPRSTPRKRRLRGATTARRWMGRMRRGRWRVLLSEWKEEGVRVEGGSREGKDLPL